MIIKWSLNNVLDVLAAAIAIVATIAIVVATVKLTELMRVTSRPQGRVTAGSESVIGDVVDLHTSVSPNSRRGRGAHIVLVEFSDFQCPYCGRYARDTFPQLAEEYIDRGVIDYVFRSFPLGFHALAAKAAEAVECAGEQHKYWEMHDRLFADQQQLTTAFLERHANAIGLNEQAFRLCLGGQMALRVAADQSEGARLGVTATPTFLLGTMEANGGLRLRRRIAGAQPYRVFKAAIDSIVRESDAHS